MNAPTPAPAPAPGPGHRVCDAKCKTQVKQLEAGASTPDVPNCMPETCTLCNATEQWCAHVPLQSFLRVRALLLLLSSECMVPNAAILLFTLLVALGFGVWCMGILDAPTRFESVRRCVDLPRHTRAP